MFSPRFFASELGQAALVSVAAMVAFVVFAALTPQGASAETAHGLIAVAALA